MCLAENNIGKDRSVVRKTGWRLNKTVLTVCAYKKSGMYGLWAMD